MHPRRIALAEHLRVSALVVALIAVAGLAGCESGMERIDRRTSALMAETSATLGPSAVVPELWEGGTPPREDPYRDPYEYENLSTDNPPADHLEYRVADESSDVIERLEAYAALPEDPLVLDLAAALRQAMRHSREYRFAEEDYLVSALQLLSERHLWGPRLSDDLSASVVAAGDGGLFDTSLLVVNDLRITQRLPYGGELSAQLLAAATEDLHRRVAGENVQSAEIILSAEVPLLRGAGQAAREPRIQAERDVIYAARGFERFRRTFLFDITTDFLSLVVQQLRIENAMRQVEQLEQFEARERALVDAGRVEPFQAALAEQETLFARDDLNAQRERYRLSVDRFKVRLGVPEDRPVVIAAEIPALAVPELDIDAAVHAALTYRLDLQNRRDRVDDSRRAVAVARNDLLADLDLIGSIGIPTENDVGRELVNFAIDDTIYRATVSLGFPLDREIERLALRESQIGLERTILDYERFRDTIAVEVRASAREIDRSRFSRDLQQENVRIAERRLVQVEASPDRADARDRSETADRLLQARNRLLEARRDLQVSILQFLLDSGQLRVSQDGTIDPLPGMKRQEPAPGENGDAAPDGS